MDKMEIDITQAKLFFEENEFWRKSVHPAVIVIPQLDYFHAFLHFLKSGKNVIPEWDIITFFMIGVSRNTKKGIVDIGSDVQFYNLKALDVLQNFINGSSFWNIDHFCKQYDVNIQFCMEYFEELEWDVKAEFRKEKQRLKQAKINDLKEAETDRKREERKVAVGFIYVISDGEKCKIGKTTNLNNRFKQLSTSNPSELKILISKKISNYHSVEEMLLNKYSSKRVSGERFSLGEQDVTDILQLLENYEE